MSYSPCKSWKLKLFKNQTSNELCTVIKPFYEMSCMKK
jgi:hypothetical protein